MGVCVMKTYALVSEHAVAEIFVTEGDVSEMFHPSMIWVDVTEANPKPSVGWAATNFDGEWRFSAPVQPTITVSEAKSRRDSLLRSSDWIVHRHRDEVDGGFPLTLAQSKYREWLEYRQKLRDVPEQEGFPDSIEWPMEPGQ
ncbi:hypothetical protein FX016_18325 [Cupriavidus gilardii]|nr:hypothetical protein FX016_18325 [Cupriavidus gilardii]